MKPWRSSYHENALLGIVISSITTAHYFEITIEESILFQTV
ncbi:MAG TPA: hypothetical protein PKK64_05940 [Saprospiraceae bacterium]|nr:hypothetical protein [Saprospiraceae bacterium]HMX88375.1 hypothetical protein [Saprospiraceae bacterium]HMZ40267.1 hypothetical protein [Saprospiraceae bacterium]HNA65557.1 hypothetical protein [Saprospiraceae bacterium]HNB29786.1 hypothetical protein [Saprospiraceae bacterium]